MLKALEQRQIDAFERQGFLGPITIIDEREAGELLSRYRRFAREQPQHVGKLDFKANLLLEWVDALARRPRLLDVMQDLLGPDLLNWNATFRNKPADGRAFADWHQDTRYIKLEPRMIICWLALTEATASNGCLRVIPASHRWPLLEHSEGGDDASILSRQQYISEDFDDSTAVDQLLRPGQAVLIDHAIVHASGPNTSQHNRLGLLIDYVATSARKLGPRDTAMLVRGIDRYHHFDHERPPRGGLHPDDLAQQRRALAAITGTMYEQSRFTPKGLADGDDNQASG